jgi:hypothetical protein
METLEPRLMDYIKKSKHYEDNDIQPIVPLEKTYHITSSDRKTLRAYFSGKKGASDWSEYIQPNNSDFTDDQFEKDPRYQRILKKQKSQRDAQDQRQNYGTIRDNYGMYTSDVAPMSALEKTYSGFDPDEGLLLDRHQTRETNPYILKHPKLNKDKSYNVVPKIQYNQRQHFQQMYDRVKGPTHDPQISNIIGKMDSYNKKLEKTYTYSSQMDLDQKKVIPFVASKNKRDIANDYCAVPYMMDGGESRDVDIENYVRYGVPEGRARSLGYPSDAEHHFDYISPDIQDPDHVIFDRPYPSRMLNKQTAHNKSNYT